MSFKKNDKGKVRMDLIPPEAEWGLAEVLTYGAEKYGPNNWEQGADWSRYYAAVRRHLNQWWSRFPCDLDTSLSHLKHAAACIAILIALEERELGVDDRPEVVSEEDETLTKAAALAAAIGW